MKLYSLFILSPFSGLAPNGDMDIARADQIMEGIDDLFPKCFEFQFFEQDNTKKVNSKFYLVLELSYKTNMKHIKDFPIYTHCLPLSI